MADKTPEGGKKKSRRRRLLPLPAKCNAPSLRVMKLNLILAIDRILVLVIAHCSTVVKWNSVKLIKVTKSDCVDCFR